MSSLAVTLSDAAVESCARYASVKHGILASASLPEPDLALSEMLLVAQEALVTAYLSVEHLSRALDASGAVSEQTHRTFDEVVDAIACETTYLSALVSFFVEQLTPPRTLDAQREAITSLCDALRSME